MSLIHRFYAALLCMALAFLTACNPAPLSVVASDFSINGVKGTGASLYTADSVKNVTIDLTSTETCTNFTSLIAKVELDEGVTISPNPSMARDYSNPVTYVVTDKYGTKVSYLLTVKGKACTTTTKDATSVTPTCTLASVGSTGYSLVFKACDATNVATYYDKTECLRDNATGLIWEGKTSSGLRAVDNKYNNLDSTSLLQIAANTVPSTTPARSPTQTEIDAPDNAVGYKNNVNALSLCGSNRWRLPTLPELQTLRLPGATTQIDLDWFSNTNLNGYYATSTQFGTQVERSSVIQFYEKGAGTVDNLLRDGTVWHPTLGALALREHSVRLVRSLF
ncbi:MAG: DUF1566 domain-containing protein [Burkholderiaceae bacterium]